jgi:hypothetical protein
MCTELSLAGRAETVGSDHRMNAPSKRVFVVSDNDGLARAIDLNLRAYFEADTILIPPSPRETPAGAGDCDLIIVATSSPTSEPVVALARASLTQRIGQVPLLIISDRPFDPDMDERIAHLDFPFHVSELHKAVQALLQEEPDAALTST